MVLPFALIHKRGAGKSLFHSLSNNHPPHFDRLSFFFRPTNLSQHPRLSQLSETTPRNWNMQDSFTTLV